MRVIRVLLLLGIGAAASGALLYLHPEWGKSAQQVVSSWQRPAASLPLIPAPLANPTLPPQADASPSASASPAAVADPGAPPPTEPPQPTSHGIDSQTGVLWTLDDCNVGPSVLLWDQQLDSKEAAKIADGGDSEYPGATVAYYQTYARHWQLDAEEAETYCWQKTWPITGADRLEDGSCASQELVFAQAMASHQQDIDSHPDHQGWNEQWIALYSRLTLLWQEACEDVPA
jgi:hypothetical protein